MPGPKTNERDGTRAVLRHARVSPYKVREVLNLVRGKPVHEAEDILRFSERDAAFIVGKVLRSAVANAENNDELDPEELYVAACFADEGTTIKRWRPRATGPGDAHSQADQSHHGHRQPPARPVSCSGCRPAAERAAGPTGPAGGRRPSFRGRHRLAGRAPSRRCRTRTGRDGGDHGGRDHGRRRHGGRGDGGSDRGRAHRFRRHGRRTGRCGGLRGGGRRRGGRGRRAGHRCHRRRGRSRGPRRRRRGASHRIRRNDGCGSPCGGRDAGDRRRKGRRSRWARRSTPTGSAWA